MLNGCAPAVTPSVNSVMTCARAAEWHEKQHQCGADKDAARFHGGSPLRIPSSGSPLTRPREALAMREAIGSSAGVHVR
jgi:hypothetical protein